MNKLRLTIGAFSKLCFVTVKTLRHYEKIGILIPHEVDEWTGYRYYDVSQLEEMNNIKSLKTLGLTLEEIRELQCDGCETPTRDMISRALENAQNELCELRRRITALQEMQGIGKTPKTMDNKITIKPLQGGTVASFRKKLGGYDELGTLCYTVIGPEMQRLGCVCPEETAYCYSVDHNKNYDPNNIDLEYCEVVSSYDSADSDLITFRNDPVVEKAVCLTHMGGYDSFGESMAKVMRYIEEHGLKIAQEPRFSYIHGVWDRDAIQEWETEIQVPVQ